jgi:ABC-type nitrate/sulfonate/bicarbonate transport system substrate-binding protein
MIFLGLVTVSACSSSSAPTTAAQDGEETPFTLKVFHNSDITGVNIFWVADAKGFAAEENIIFDDVGVVPSGELVASVVAGKLDVGGAHVNRTIAGINGGAKIKAVAASSETLQDFPHMCFVAVKGSPIKSARDLVGKKLGLATYGGCNEYTTYAWFDKNGIAQPKEQMDIFILPGETKLLQALEQGEVDVVGIHKDPSWVLAQGKYDLLYTDFDIWGTIGGNTPHYFSEKFINEHPEVVRRFVRVIAKTNNWVNENRKEAERITAERGGVDPSQVRSANYTKDAVMKPETVQVWIDLLEKYEEIKPGITPEQIYTNEFNELAPKI